MIPSAYRPLATGKASRSAVQASIGFLLDLWNYDADAYTFIGTRHGERWRDHPIKGDREAQIAAILTAHPADRFDLYFCPNAFAQPQRKTIHALPSRYAWCDIDDADPAGYDPAPNILWETSPGRFQGLWLWRKSADGHMAEQYSKNIWAKDGGDKGGWSITKMLRLPGSVNHKPAYAKPVVTLRAYDGRPQRLPASIRTIIAPNTPPTVSMDEPINGNAVSIMQRYRMCMGLEAGTLMTAKRVMRGEGELTRPLRERAGQGNLNQEVRQHCKSLAPGDRAKLLHEALEAEDYATVEAIVGAQPFLSGMSREEQDIYVHRYNAQQNPQLVARLTVMRAALDKMGRDATKVMTEMQKAVGASPAKVKAINAANEQAVAALRIEPNS